MKNKFLLVALWAAFHIQAQQRVYVNTTSTGNNNGTTWTDAYTNLHTALFAAQPGDTIWVAEGTYKPAKWVARDSSFQLKSGVALYGGFAGIEMALTERNWEKHPTVLSGDLGVQGDSSDNSYTILYMEYPDSSTVLDGLVFQHGCADYSGTTVPAIHPWRSGGAVYIMGAAGDAYPTIQHCLFKHNRARNNGGAIYVNGADLGSVAPRIWRCTFEDNIARDGGAIRRDGGSLVERAYDLGWCTFKRNHAKNFGGGYCFYENYLNDSLEITGCVFDSCSAILKGGGVFALVGKPDGGTFKVNTCYFSYNKALEAPAIMTTDFLGLPMKKIAVENSSFHHDLNGYYAIAFHHQGASPSSEILAKKCQFEAEAPSTTFSAELGGAGRIRIDNCRFNENCSDIGISAKNGIHIIKSNFTGHYPDQYRIMFLHGGESVIDNSHLQDMRGMGSYYWTFLKSA